MTDLIKTLMQAWANDGSEIYRDAAEEIARLQSEVDLRSIAMPIRSQHEMTDAEFRIFALGWMECEAAHGIVE